MILHAVGEYERVDRVEAGPAGFTLHTQPMSGGTRMQEGTVAFVARLG